jgi:hypothetical protein
MRALKLLAFIFLITHIYSCKKNEKNTPNMDKHESYFGLIAGRFVTYNVREIFHDETADIQHDTLEYQLKTVIGDTMIDNSGRTVRKFFRYKRENTNQNWFLTDVWITLIDGNYAELIEENQRVIKMLLPVSPKTYWNANVFNVSPTLDCFYDQIHKSLSINGLEFDSTVTIEQENERNLIEFKRKYEVYGNRIGLISKYFKDLKISNFDTLNIKSGHELTYTCADFGIE